jgi:taurine--2-oxoglutarate transaminase
MNIMELSEILQNNFDHTLFGWSPQKGLDPIIAKKGKGVYFQDINDKRYLDFVSQFMTVNVGHGDERINQAIMDQLGDLAFVYGGAVTEIRGLLGKKLAAIAPGHLNKTLLTTSGAEAIENAIKLARMYTGRHKIISFYRSFHGASYGAMSVSGDPRRFPIDTQQMPNVIRVENPYVYRCPFYSNTPEECTERTIANIAKVIQYENPGSVAAILLEGESGYSGCIKYPSGFWSQLRQLADEHGILIIDDEVMSGFGRTGKWFAADHHGVVPDMMCISKGMTSGYLPMGGLMVSDAIAAAYDDKPLALGLTYTAHAACCAAALANIQVIEEDGLVDNAAKMGAYMDERMKSLIDKHPTIGDYRNTGLFGCIELVKDRHTKEPIAPFNAKPADLKIQRRMEEVLREMGVLTFIRWNWVFLAPPLCVNEAQIDEGLAAISEAIAIADAYYHS